MKPRTYAAGFVDALALATVAILLLLAAVFAGGCATVPNAGGRDRGQAQAWPDSCPDHAPAAGCSQVQPRPADAPGHAHARPSPSEPNDLQPATRRASTGTVYTVVDVRVVEIEGVK